MSYFANENMKITSLSVAYKISKQSSIKVFDINNFIYIFELFKIIFYKTSKV